MHRALPPDVVVVQGAWVLTLPAGEDEALLIRGDPLLVLNRVLHVFDGVAACHVEGDDLACESLDKELKAAAAASASGRTATAACCCESLSRFVKFLFVCGSGMGETQC